MMKDRHYSEIDTKIPIGLILKFWEAVILFDIQPGKTLKIVGSL
jgi:hypothetical protein